MNISSYLSSLHEETSSYWADKLEKATAELKHVRLRMEKSNPGSKAICTKYGMESNQCKKALASFRKDLIKKDEILKRGAFYSKKMNGS